MNKFFITVAVFLMIFQGGHTVGHHDHVHYELPEWEVLKESTIHSSGSTNPIKQHYSLSAP